MAWSWLPFHPCTHVLEKWFRPTVIGGGSPPQRNLAVGDDNLRPGTCVKCGSGIATVTGPQLALPRSLAKWT